MGTEPVAFVAGKWHRLRYPALATAVRECDSAAAETLEHGCKESTANPAELTALAAAAGRAAPGLPNGKLSPCACHDKSAAARLNNSIH